MRICFAVLHYDPRVATSDVYQYLDDVSIHRELPAQLAGRGHDVHVVHLYPFAAKVTVDRAHHHFIPADRISQALSLIAGKIARRDPVIFQPAARAIGFILALQPDVVHFHGLTLTWNLLLLTARLNRRVPLVVHYHGGAPARNPIARLAQRYGVRRASRFLFTTAMHAEPFVDSCGLARSRVVEFLETSTTFRSRPRPEARQVTGILGNPVFLWTGRLHPNKDPLTALRGFERIAAEWPGAQLYLYYLTDELLPDLKAFLATRPPLAERVHFRGRVSNAKLEDVYNSADYFLQASWREIGGFAPLEAMATGTIPVISDIPSFRAMTDGGRYGILFPPGDDLALARAVLGRSDNIPALSAAVRRRFEEALSYPSLGGQLERIYVELRASTLLS